MLVKRLAFILLGLGVSGCTAGPERPEASTDEALTEAELSQTLVKVGERTITVGDFAERLAEQSPYLQARFESPARRKELLDNLVRYELLVYEAKRRGYSDAPDVIRARRRIMIEELIRREVDAPLQGAPVTEEEVQAAYEENPTRFDRPAQVRASHIFIRDRARARRLLERAQQGDVSAFSRLARERSEDPLTRADGGDLQYFTENGDGQPPAALRKAAFSIDHVGTVYPELVAQGGGYHIVMLTAKRAALTRTYAQAKRAVRHELTRQRKDAAMEALKERLAAEVPVEIDYEALKQVRVDAPSPSNQP